MDEHPTTERARIDAFLAPGSRIALVGASTNEQDFSRAMMRELIAHDIDVVPVHPGVDRIGDRRAYGRVTDIEGRVDGALIMTRPEAAAGILEECARAGIDRVWLHRGVGQGSVSDDAIATAHAHELELVSGRCPLMFLGERPAAVHRVHAAMLKLVGRYPRRPPPARA